MLLVVGPAGSGKTTLIQRLQSGQPLGQLHTTVPTVGSNISDLRLGAAKKPTTTIRELGGCMSPLWPVYYTADLRGVIYVIDASDVTQTACAAVLLIELLEHPQLQGAKTLRAPASETGRGLIVPLPQLVRLCAPLQERQTAV